MNELGTRSALALLSTLLPIACDQGEPAPVQVEAREVAPERVATPAQAVAKPVEPAPVEPAPVEPLPAFVMARLVHDGPVTDLAWSADGAVIATASSDAKLRVWDAATYTLTRTIDVPPSPGPHHVAISSDGATLVTHTEREVQVFDGRTGSSQHTLAHEGQVFAVAVSADGRTLASGGVDGLRIWNPDGSERRHVEQRRAAVVSVLFSGDGTTLASGWGDRRVRTVDAASGKIIRTIKTDQPASDLASDLAYSQDGVHVAAPTGAAQFGIFATATGKHIATIPLAQPLAFGAGGNLMLAAGTSEVGDFVISIVDVNSAGIVRGFLGHTGDLTDAMFSPDSTAFATASLDHGALIWAAP